MNKKKNNNLHFNFFYEYFLNLNVKNKIKSLNNLDRVNKEKTKEEAV